MSNQGTSYEKRKKERERFLAEAEIRAVRSIGLYFKQKKENNNDFPEGDNNDAA